MKPSPKTQQAPNSPQVPHSHAQRWLMAYDIRDPKRLQRVGRYMNKEGLRLQFSVYVLKGSREQVEQVMEQLRQLIDEKFDDVRIYPLTEKTRIWGLGTQFADGENTLSDAYMDKIIQPQSEETTEDQARKGLSF